MRRWISLCVVACLLPSCSGKGGLWGSKSPQIEVIQARLTANDAFVDVQFRERGETSVEIDQTNTYILDEATGERFHIARFQRAERLAEARNTDESAVHNVLINNRERKLRPGSLVTVVIGPARQKDVPVQK